MLKCLAVHNLPCTLAMGLKQDHCFVYCVSCYCYCIFFMKLFHSFEILVNDYWCLSRASGHLRDLLVWAQGSSNILAHIGWEAQQLPGKRWMIHKYWFSFSIWPPGFPEGWQTGAKDFGGNRKEEDGGREVSDDFDVAGISGGLQSTGQWWANQKKTF